MALVCGTASPTQGSEISLDLAKKDNLIQDSGGTSLRAGKNQASPKEFYHSILNSVNKSTSQIKKPGRRRSPSPLNWFPRKKTDSFLNRKIKLLQEVGGMKSSLLETLGDSNPHYCLVEREKIAAREAARKAMEARKAAMVEASWCRMLRAARIPNQEADRQLEKAEKYVEEAFETAAAMGVIMYDKPDCPQRPSEVEISPRNGGGSTHTVTASFETAFEVDKEVAAAVKAAFLQLALTSSTHKDEFRDLLRKISQNPDFSEIDKENLEIKPNNHSDVGEGMESKSSGNNNFSNLRKDEKMLMNRQAPGKCIAKSGDLVNMMLDRLKCLQEEELSSLATIVATCGLNDALHEEEHSKQYGLESVGSNQVDGQIRKQVTELPSLDKFLVKHVSRLEREVQEAKNARQSNQVEETAENTKVSDNLVLAASSNAASLSDFVPDLGSFLVKHKSRLEKEIEEAKKQAKTSQMCQERMKDKQSKHKQDAGQYEEFGRTVNGSTGGQVPGKENVDSNKIKLELLKNQDGMEETEKAKGVFSHQDNMAVRQLSRIERAKLEVMEAFLDKESLGKVLIKHVSRLEREKMAFRANDRMSKEERKSEKSEVREGEGLDKVLVKHVSRLEKEKMTFAKEGGLVLEHRKKPDPEVGDFESLDKALVKHVPRLEKEKMALNVTERTVREEKMSGYADGAAIEMKKQQESLGDILVKHKSRLEKEKGSMLNTSADNIKHSETRRAAREREMLEAWGGLSLGNSVKPHLSRLEREKAAWRRAEEKQRQAAG
ncbi:uncharacterized protein [Aristolochia californica]|uniref:uncharacterized protein n=1 Tax=Aristolochia californica TaxID=171875 RepID=UPI0035D966E9